MAKPGPVPKVRYLTEEKKQLVADNYWLIWWFIDKKMKYKPTGANELDEVGECLAERLCIAADTFDLDRGIKFSTYAIRAFQTALIEQHRVKKLLYRDLVVLDFSTVTEGKKNKENPDDILPSDFRPRFTTSITTTWDDLEPIIAEVDLTSWEERIILYHYHLGFSLSKIGTFFNRTGERIRQIHKSAIEKIGDYVRSQDYRLEDFLHEIR